MIATPNRPGFSYYPPYVSLGDMLRSMSEFLMLATSRSPAQWMTSELATTRAATGDSDATRNASAFAERQRKPPRARTRTKAKHGR